ncbi:MAG: chemotaxis response regulator protein-glutamate methylesterase [Verrucomicrobiota bacterium]
MKPPKPIRVLAVDDSPFFRKVLTDILGPREDIELVGCAGDAYEARDRLAETPVDVLTLDLEMPRMPGLTFLKLLMERKPMPVIVLSSHAPTGSQAAVDALFSGAFAVLGKPQNLEHKGAFGDRLVQDIQRAASAPIRPRRPAMLESLTTSPMPRLGDPRQIIALGASTGGTQALEEVLAMLPARLPGIVMVQHIPAGFSESFAARLDRACAMEVREARDGEVVRPGTALLAPGDHHLEVRWFRDHYRVHLHDGPPVEHQRPSVDVLFNSLARDAGPHVVAALLTGMGRDGAAGMKRLHDRGAITLAQDAGSSVVYGMARKAIELHAVDTVAPLEGLAAHILKALDKTSPRSTPTSHA